MFLKTDTIFVYSCWQNVFIMYVFYIKNNISIEPFKMTYTCSPDTVICDLYQNHKSYLQDHVTAGELIKAQLPDMETSFHKCCTFSTV